MEYTESNVAEWMVNEIKFKGMLSQGDAIAYVKSHFGDEFVFVNEKGNSSLSKEVKKAFRKLHAGKIAWEQRRIFLGMDLIRGRHDTAEIHWPNNLLNMYCEVESLSVISETSV